MVNRLVAVQAAEKAGIDKQADVKQEIELARQGILVRALMADHLKKNPVTDAKIQAEYDQIKKEQAGKQEYKLRHILVKDEKARSEEHTSELQSLMRISYAVFCLKKKNRKQHDI